jgi:hypothetical protein
MFPASTKGGGNCFAFPDVCKTPAPPAGPVPVPYPNTAMNNQATKTSRKVKICGKETITTKSEIPRSMGDEAGTAGGVVSGGNMDKVVFKKGSSKVKVEGAPVVSLTSVTAQNGSNANAPAGAVVSPSQAKVFVAP